MNSGETVIRAENLSKCYRIGLNENVNDSLARNVFDFIKSPVKNYRRHRSLYNFDDVKLNPAGNSPADIIWALRDVSFEVKQGEIVGIIGMNGAGKSTLLKILSRITNPTSGHAEIRGRISSLLEVGTGFHPELTGRENVYLNGTVLGMRKKEIDRKFDEIVDFSGVETFIDTPVKRYSSGMKVRLAFAVAAHLEPEILLVDEVLAVGDVQFQKKCLSKMESVSRHGRTILFVTHYMQVVTRLCPRTILLNGGAVKADGPSHNIVSIYMDSEKGTRPERVWPVLTDAPGDDTVRLRAVRVRTEDGRIMDVLNIDKPLVVEMEYEVLRPGYSLCAYIRVINENGITVFESYENDPVWKGVPRPSGRYVSAARVPGDLLAEGMFYVAPALRSVNPPMRRFRVDDAIAFRAVNPLHSDSSIEDYMGGQDGVVRPHLDWETQINPIGSKIQLNR
ncbi:MAG: ABC transporter ATP-binding protein [Nitrospirae bacterium]|nr:ABC transporter ATP-binding protein [Nitrospirota bacterium]